LSHTRNSPHLYSLLEKGFGLVNTSIVIYLSMILLPMIVYADTVVLKGGTTIQTKRAWQEEGKIKFYINGLVVSLPKKDVREIKYSQGDIIEIEKTKDNIFMPDGFRGLRWGNKLSHLRDMEYLETDTSLPGIEKYVRVGDISEIGKAKLETVVYAFWHGRLYTVTIWTQDYANYEALREVVFHVFGKGHQADKSLDRYIWSKKSTDMMLEYIEKGQYGMFWMRSKELYARLKLSEYSGPISYVRSLRSEHKN